MSAKTSSSGNLKYWLRLAVFAAIIVILLALCAFGYLVKIQLDILVTPGRMPITQTPASFGLPYQDVTLTSSDDLNIAGWYIPGTQSNAVVLVHGINTNRQVMLPTAKLLAEAGYHLLLLDMRGHGESEGDKITYGYNEALDVQAAVDFLIDMPEVENVGLLGSSMGGAAVARAAAIDPRVKAVIVERSYAGMTDAANDAFDEFTIFPKWPFAPLIVGLAEWQLGITVEQVDSARDLATVSPRYVMIIHDKNDTLMPVYHAEKMFAAAREPKTLWILEEVGHQDPAIERPEEYRERVVGFFDEAFSADP